MKVRYHTITLPETGEPIQLFAKGDMERLAGLKEPEKSHTDQEDQGYLVWEGIETDLSSESISIKLFWEDMEGEIEIDDEDDPYPDEENTLFWAEMMSHPYE